jgi:hypothetical protein
MAQTVGGYPDPTGRDLADCHALAVALPAGIGTLDLSRYVKSFQTTKEIVSDLPDGTRLQVGYPSASASFTLADEGVGPFGGYIAYLFARYNTSSPLYHNSAVHAPLTIDAGLSNVLVRQFTGLLDDYIQKSDGSFEFVCIDKRSLLRSVASLPPVVTLPPFNAGLTSEYAIDALLRAARPAQDISTWPARRADCVLAVGFRTSLWPEVGSLDQTYTQPTSLAYTPGAFGSALSGDAAAHYLTASPVTGAVFCEWWTTGAGIGSSSAVTVTDNGAGANLIRLTVSATGVVAEWGVSGIDVWTPSGGVTTGAHHVGFSLSASNVLTTYFDGQTHTVGTVGPFASMGSVYAFPNGATIEALQVSAETAPTFTAFTPTAVLDPSLNTLLIVPDMSGDPWQVLQLIATAELGVCGFDEQGVFRFRNRRTIQAQPLTRTVTSTDALVDLNVQTSAASVANRCQVDATPWQFAATSRIWQLDVVTKVPAHGSITLTPTLDVLAVETDSSVSVLPDGWLGTVHSYYRASGDQYGNAEHQGLTFAVTQISSTQLRIVVSNPTTSDAWLVSPSNYTDLAVGTPVLYIAGRPVLAASTTTQDFQWPPLILGSGGAPDTGGAASTDVGEIAVQLTGNQWIQDRDTALMLARDVVLDQCIARDTFDNVSIVPDHRIQLTDLVRIIDTSATGADEYLYVFAVSTSYDGDSQSQTITARTLGPPGAWLLGIPGRSELGSPGTAYVYA